MHKENQPMQQIQIPNATPENPPSDTAPAFPAAKKNGYRSHVRFTRQEWKRINQDAIKRGISVAKLLKQTYFNNLPVLVLLRPEDKRVLMTFLARAGVLLKECAKHLNTGFHDEKLIAASVAEARQAVASVVNALNAKVAEVAATTR